MARLIGRLDTNQTEAFVTLEIVPVTPSKDGPRDAYTVSIVEHMNVVVPDITFGRMFNVYKWPLGHIWMYRIARAFQIAYKIVDEKLDFSLNPPEMALSTGDSHEPMYINESIDWLKICLRGRTREEGPRIFAEILIQTDWEEFSKRDSRVGNFIRFFFTCTPDESRHFGNTLYKECIMARDLRRRHGIAAPEDNWK